MSAVHKPTPRAIHSKSSSNDPLLRTSAVDVYCALIQFQFNIYIYRII
jgi:hypothetical protein